MTVFTEADCYTAFYERGPTVEVPFIERLARSYGLRHPVTVLDMGCGTGRMLRPLADLGWRVVGREPHPNYAATARAVAGEQIEVEEGGFDDLEAVDRFDLVVAIGNPLWYLLTPQARAEALDRTYRALRPAGVVVLEGANLPWILEHYRPPEASEVDHGGVRIRRSPRHQIDHERGVFTHIDTFAVTETGQELVSTHSMAILSADDITGALDEAGFSAVRTYPGWQCESSGPPEGSRLLVAARRPYVGVEPADQGLGVT